MSIDERVEVSHQSRLLDTLIALGAVLSIVCAMMLLVMNFIVHADHVRHEPGVPQPDSVLSQAITMTS